MKVQKITVEKSKKSGRNYDPNSDTQVIVEESDSAEDLGVGVYVQLNDDITLLISKEFIDYFSKQLETSE